ncbi:hypothetical protein [Amycolatopsis sp. NPDC003676]
MRSARHAERAVAIPSIMALTLVDAFRAYASLRGPARRRTAERHLRQTAR